MPHTRLSRWSIFTYALGSVGTAGFGTVPGLLLLYYLTSVIGVSPAVAGLVVFAPKAWDVLINPYVGRLSDRAVGRTGTRAPYLLAGALSLPIFFGLMFWPSPDWTPNASAGFVAVMFLLAASGFALFQVPYIAMPAEITDSYAERTTLMSYRIVFLTVGILAFGAGSPALVQAAGGGLAGYRWMGVAAAALIAVGLLGAWLGATTTKTVLTAAAAEGTLLDQLRLTRRNKMFVVLLGAYMIQALASGCMLAGAPYFARYVLGDPAATTFLFGALVAPAVLVMPVWARIGHRLGKRSGFMMAAGVFTVASLALIAGRHIPAVAVYSLVCMCGVGYAGMQLFPLSMLPDAIDLDEARSGEKRAGVFTGLWTAGETASLALGPAVFSLVLSLSGFISSRADEIVEQPPSAILGVALGFSLLPALLLAASFPLIRTYTVDAAALAQARGLVPSTQDIV